MSVVNDAPASIRGNRPFLRYWIGHAVSTFGDQISILALPLIAITTLDASAGEVGLLTAAIWAPNLVSLFIGTWADRNARPRSILVVANVVQAASVATVPVAWAMDALSMPVLYIAALALGLGGVVFDTSYTRFFVRIVPREQYVTANSMLSTTNATSGTAGPAVGGALIQVLTAPLAMVVDAVSFLASAAIIRSVRESAPSPEPELIQSEPYFRRLVAGTTYLAGNPYLRASLACSAIMNLSAFIVQALLVLYATRHLDLSPGQIGLAFGLGGLGGLMGAGLAGVVARRFGTGRTIALGALLYTLPFSALALASPGIPGLVLIAVVEAVSSFGIMLFDINNNSMRTAVTHESMRSRVAGAYSTVNYGTRPLGAVAGGLLGSYLGISTTLLIAGFGGFLAIAWLITSPVIKVKAITDL